MLTPSFMRARCSWLTRISHRLWQPKVFGGVFFGICGALSTTAEAAWAQDNVLIIHSYQENLPWVKSLKRGIEEQFEQSADEVQLFHEFLDAKRFPDLNHQTTFLENLKVKYQNTSIDLILVSDDPGLVMMLKQRENYFPEPPLVFFGINTVQPELLTMPGVTGVFETHDQLETAAEALRQNGYEGLIVISDSSETGQVESEQAAQILDLPQPPEKLVILEDLTAETLAAELSPYPEHWPVLLVGQLRQGDSNGALINVGETTALVRDRVQNPLYGASLAHVKNGVVGGKILDGEHHAKQTAGLAQQLLAGTPVEEIAPIVESENIWLFDAQELKRFSIDVSELPVGRRLLNQKVSFYEQHWRIVWLIGAGFAATLLIILLLAEVIRRGAAAARILEENQTRYKDLAQAGANVFWELDTQMRFIYVSGDTQGLYGLEPDGLAGQNFRTLLENYPGLDFDWKSFDKQFKKQSVIEDFRFQVLGDGNKKLQIFKLNGKPIFERENFCGYRGIIREITEEYYLAEDLAYQATYDSLTGLLNRQAFDQNLKQTVRRVQNAGYPAVLCYLDLDQFKIVNDTAGHAVGDRLLAEIAEVLRQSIRTTDVLARLGGDEFGLILEHCSLSQADAICKALTQKVQDYRFCWANRQFRVGVSAGIVPLEAEGTNAVELLSRADLACYRAKDLGRNQAYVAEREDETLATQKKQMGHLATLNQALEEERFFLVQQPIVPLSHASKAPHFELLLRLRDEQGQVVSPGLFIPEAERYGLITQIDRWVLQKALQALVYLALPSDSLVSINLSGTSLSNLSFLEETVDMIQHAANGPQAAQAISPQCICFEITETAAIENLAAVKVFMKQLKALGVKFALDDFGSGVSSFGYLRELPVDFLKIDGSLVRNIDHDVTDREIVGMIARLAEVMSMQTIAEFVENDDIRQRLQEMGVSYGQGYGLGKPQLLEHLSQPVAA